MINYFLENGVARVLGVEPSGKNVQASKMLYPNARVLKTDFMSMGTEHQYDLVVSVMVLPNILDLDAAFDKFRNLMQKG